jgi:hypothetical protein
MMVLIVKALAVFGGAVLVSYGLILAYDALKRRRRRREFARRLAADGRLDHHSILDPRD